MLEKITITNWMGHEEFSREIKNGKNLIYGKNAAGKSSIAKAIAFGLTGILPKKSDPRRNRKIDTIVDLEIVGPNNKKYLVRRQILKGVRIKETLFIYKADQLSEAAFAGDEATSFLQQIFGMKKDLFERIIYMKEEDVHEFLAKPDGSVLHELDRLIGLEKAHKLSREIIDLAKIVKDEHKHVKKDREEIATSVKRESGVKESKTDIKAANKRLGDIKTEAEELLELQGHLKEYNRIDTDLSELKRLVEVTDNSKLETKLMELMLTYKEGMEKLDSAVKSKKKELATLQDARGTLEAKSELKEKIIQDLSAADVSECPTCGREMGKKLVTEVVKKLNKEHKELASELKTKLTKISSLLTEIEKKQQEAANTKRKREQKKEQKDQAEKLQREFEKVHTEVKHLSKKHQYNLEQIEHQLNELEKEEYQLIQTIGRAKGAKEITEKMVEQKLKAEEDLKHKLKILELIKKAIGETTIKLRESYTANVKNVAEDIWKQYKGESWTIEWDESNFVPIANPPSSDRPLYAFEMSGSEKFLILLAIRLAIQQTLDQFQLLIIDEPCQHLDVTNGTIIRDIITS
ncbi:MAG: AAA family ATPase, partial [Candidatus Hodarchaeales archaeon]